MQCNTTKKFDQVWARRWSQLRREPKHFQVFLDKKGTFEKTRN